MFIFVGSYKPYHQQHTSQELIEGVLLSFHPIKGGANAIFQLFTENKGKISGVTDFRFFTTQGISILDTIEASMTSRSLYQQSLASRSSYSQQHQHSSRLISVSSLEKTMSAQLHFCPDITQTSEIAYQNRWKKALFQVGAILNKFLLPEEPRKDMWNFLRAIFAVEKPFRNPFALTILISSLFFSEEGINKEDIMQSATRLSSEFHHEVLKDIDIFLAANSDTIREHDFSEKTSELFLDMIGIIKK